MFRPWMHNLIIIITRYYAMIGVEVYSIIWFKKKGCWVFCYSSFFCLYFACLFCSVLGYSFLLSFFCTDVPNAISLHGGYMFVLLVYHQVISFMPELLKIFHGSVHLPCDQAYKQQINKITSTDKPHVVLLIWNKHI